MESFRWHVLRRRRDFRLLPFDRINLVVLDVRQVKEAGQLACPEEQLRTCQRVVQRPARTAADELVNQRRFAGDRRRFQPIAAHVIELAEARDSALQNGARAAGRAGGSDQPDDGVEARRAGFLVDGLAIFLNHLRHALAGPFGFLQHFVAAREHVE